MGLVNDQIQLFNINLILDRMDTVQHVPMPEEIPEDEDSSKQKESSKPNESFEPDLSPKSSETTAKQDSSPSGSEDISNPEGLEETEEKAWEEAPSIMNCSREKN